MVKATAYLAEEQEVCRVKIASHDEPYWAVSVQHLDDVNLVFDRSKPQVGFLKLNSSDTNKSVQTL